MKIEYKTVENHLEMESLDIGNALYLTVGESTLRLSEKDGVLKISGDTLLTINPMASNVIEVSENKY